MPYVFTRTKWESTREVFSFILLRVVMGFLLFCFKFDLRERQSDTERKRKTESHLSFTGSLPKRLQKPWLSQDPSAWAGTSSRNLMRSRAAVAPTSAPLQDAGVPSVSLTHCTTAVYIESELFMLLFSYLLQLPYLLSLLKKYIYIWVRFVTWKGEVLIVVSFLWEEGLSAELCTWFGSCEEPRRALLLAACVGTQPVTLWVLVWTLILLPFWIQLTFLKKQWKMAQLHGSLPPARETWAELWASRFGLAQPPAP